MSFGIFILIALITLFATGYLEWNLSDRYRTWTRRETLVAILILVGTSAVVYHAIENYNSVIHKPAPTAKAC